jgi:hypothetical protein
MIELKIDMDEPGVPKPDEEPERYRGPERRSGDERRQHGDRREDIRFELEKGDRRSGKDRRKNGRWGEGKPI